MLLLLLFPLFYFVFILCIKICLLVASTWPQKMSLPLMGSSHFMGEAVYVVVTPSGLWSETDWFIATSASLYRNELGEVT